MERVRSAGEKKKGFKMKKAAAKKSFDGVTMWSFGKKRPKSDERQPLSLFRPELSPPIGFLNERT